MLVQKFKPTMRDLVKVDSLPDNLGFLQDNLANVLDKLYYENLRAFKSAEGHTASYDLDIHTFRQIVLFKIPGTEMSFILNPDDNLGASQSSVFNVSLSYELELLKYVPGANISSFAFDVRSYVNLIFNIFDITIDELVEEAINVFIEDINNPPMGLDPIQDFVDDYNSRYTPTISSYTDLPDIISQISTNHDIIEIIINDYLDNAFDRLKKLLGRFTGALTEDRLKDLILPKISASINEISFGLELPRSVFVPLDGSDMPLPEPAQSMIRVNAGSFLYNTETGFHFEKDFSFDFTKSEILNSGFTIEIQGLKFDLSEKTNIPEADLDGRPNNFKGVYIKDASIGFPAFWNHDDPTSTGVLNARNLLVGTGGVSGTIGMEAKVGGDPAPFICANLGGDGFSACLNSFYIEFQQNAIVSTNINGTMKIPGFKDSMGNDAEINIDVFIGQNGEFSVTASEAQGITAISIPDIFDFTINSLAIGREGGRFYAALNGSLNFAEQPAPIGQFIPDEIQIQKLIIWQDGEVEFEGGTLVLPNAISLKIPPAELSITAIGFGSHEQIHDGNLRKYKFFEFSGGINVNPGGVDARGDGIKFYYTVDNDSGAGLDPHIFVRIQSIAVDMVIPGSASEETAALLLSGFLSMKDPAPTNPDPAAGTEYAGGIDFTLPKLKMGGSAAMRFNPRVPAFIIDVGLELSSPIVLGSTGLGIYGFRGLLGLRYVASKTSAGVPEDGKWWQYYKAKVADQYAEGIQVGKFDQTPGFSLGAGVSLATAPDSGKAFSSKIFFLLSLPEVFLLQGQGQILKERIGLDTTADPPFFALIAITNNSVEAAFGVDYKVPDDKRPGSIAKVYGILEMGFFFNDSSAWYINVGRETPENMRIQARLLELFDAYFYLMLSGNGIRAGAGASFDIQKKFGPLRAELGAYLDVAGKIQFRPKQYGASIQLGGNVGLYIFKFGFSISVHASLAAEAPKPFIVSGDLEVCIKVVGKEFCAKFSFTWTFDNTLDLAEIPIADPATAAKALNMLTRETFAVASGLSLPTSGEVPNLDNFVVPMDSFIEIELKKGVLPSNDIGTGAFFGKSVVGNFGGNVNGANYLEYVAPQKGKSNRVRHKFLLNNIEVFSWDPTQGPGGDWVPYHIYQAASPLQSPPPDITITPNVDNLKLGYWQYQSTGLHNKLRILSTSPMDFLAQGTSDFIPENSGVGYQQVFCEQEEKQKLCITFDLIEGQHPLANGALLALVPADQLKFLDHTLFRVLSLDGNIVERPYLTYNNALALKSEQEVEFFFTEPSALVSLVLQSNASDVTIKYFKEEVIGQDASGLPIFNYILVQTQVVLQANLSNPVTYEDLSSDHSGLISKVTIIGGTCEQGQGEELCDAELTPNSVLLDNFFNGLIQGGLMTEDHNMYPSNAAIYDNIYVNTSLYSFPVFDNTSIEYMIESIGSTGLVFTVSDNFANSCQYTLNVISAPREWSFSQITEFVNFGVDPDSLNIGSNYNFTIEGKVPGQKQNVFFEGSTTCHNLINCVNDACSFVYQVCHQALGDFLYNQTILSLTEVQAEIDNMLEGLNNSVQPIWRPSTYYAIRFSTLDKAEEEGGSQAQNHGGSYVFAFKTEGPIGHFHQFKPEFAALEAIDKEDEFKLKSLQHYIDYSKSYPNANGRLIDAKPVYYADPKLLMFYKHAYVYEMFRDWDTYNGNDATNHSLEVIIKDPAPESGDPQPAPVASKWVNNDVPILSQSTTTLNNMISNGSPCVSISGSISPVGVNSEFLLPTLKPLKLYAALFNSKFKLASETNFTTNEVHRYVFQTSQFADFAEHINSYKLLIDETTSTVLKEALFELKLTLDANSVNTIQSILGNTMIASDPLIRDFAIPFDRIINGVMQITSLHPQVTTEFNILRNTVDNSILGVLIRTPEPFNDPKTSETVLSDTVKLSINGDSSNNYRALFSKDNRYVLVTNDDNSLNLSTGAYQLTFDYRLFNGVDYALITSVVVDLNIN